MGGVRGLKKAAQAGEVCAVMETRQLIVWGFAVACLSDAHFLRVVVPTYWDADVRPSLMEDMVEGAAAPERDHSREPAQNPEQPQGNRIRPAVEKFPQKVPDGQSAVLKNPSHLLQQQQSVKTDRLAVRCSESKIQVEVKQDLMGKGKLINPEELTLGGCSPIEVDNWAHVLVFESELHGCGSTLVVRKLSFTACFLLTSETNLLSLLLDEGAHVDLHLHAHLPTQKDGQHAHRPEPARPHRRGVPLPEVTPPGARTTLVHTANKPAQV